MRGSMIWIQGTFPPKPGIDRPKNYQQKISTGIPGTEDGFRSAEKEAKLIAGEMASKTFDWRKYMKSERLPENRPCKVWVERFRIQYLSQNTLQESTWRGDWEKIYKRLPQDEPLTAELLQALALQPEKNSRNRLETCRKLQKLADFADIKVDLLRHEGTYGPSKVRDRDIPTDEEIAQWWSKIPAASWRWVFGMMAAFGLRDHEVFFTEWSDEGLWVMKGKTGRRLVHQALYPEWVDQWDLRTVHFPKIEDVDRLYEEHKLGDKVARQFRRYQIPCRPYDLRHAYGIRASVTFELPVTTAAALMGHSPDIHLKRYHKHIQLKTNQDAAKRIMRRPDRPKAPSIPIDA